MGEGGRACQTMGAKQRGKHRNNLRVKKCSERLDDFRRPHSLSDGLVGLLGLDKAERARKWLQLQLQLQLRVRVRACEGNMFK